MDSKIRLVEYTEEFLEYSYHWLSDSEINRLTDTGPITREGQRQWFSSLPLRSDYKVWGVKCGNEPVGVCGLKHIQHNSAEYFGYIGEKSRWGGTGSEMMQCLERKAVDMYITHLYLKVLAFNVRAISLYKKMGYTEISFDGDFFVFKKELPSRDMNYNKK